MSDVCEPRNAVFVTTTASVPSYAAWVRLSAAPDIVSVSVYAAVTNATPTTMASVVRAVRTGRAARPFNATRIMRAP